MKRLIAILIVLCTLLSLIGCVDTNEPTTPPTKSSSSQGNNEADDNESTGGSTSSSTNSSTIDSTANSTQNSTSGSTQDSASSSTNDNENPDNETPGGNTKPNPPEVIIVPDRTKYKATTVGTGDNMAIYYINEVMKHPYLTPYYNGYKTALTMTFDDGYDVETGTIVSDLFEKYGYRGTAMLCPCFVGSQDKIDGWNKVFARGYLNAGCHSYNHVLPKDVSKDEYDHEIRDAIMFLREKFPGQRVLTYATPFAHITDDYEDYLRDYVIGNREESGGNAVIPGQKFNPYRVRATSVNVNKDLSVIHNVISNSVKNQNWVVELLHCVIDESSGKTINSTDMSKALFEYHCKWIYRNHRDDIWFANFEEVLIYAKQVETTTVQYTACDRESLTFTVTPDLTLDKELYNFPMSLRVYLPQEIADSAYAVINDVYQPLEIEYELDTGYMYTIVRDIPTDKVTDVKVYIGGNKTMKNNCIHKYAQDSVIEPTHDTFGYTINKCTKCEHTYNSAYTAPVHDYSGEVVEVIAPEKNVKGLSKCYCTMCDKYEVIEVDYVEE